MTRTTTDRRGTYVFGVVCLAAAIVLPFVVNRFILNVFTLSMVFALLAMSANFLSHAGLASLGQGGIMATSAYALGFAATRADVGLLPQALIGVAMGIVAGLVFGLLTARTEGVYFILATLSLGMVVWGLSIRLTSVTGGENGLRGIERPGFAESYRSLYYLSAATVVVGILAAWVASRSPLGLVLRGVRDQESRLRMLGCPVARFKVLAFALSGFFAGLSGVLYAYYNRFVNPSAATFNTSGKAVLMVIVGGIGTLAGPVIGAVIVTSIENVMNYYTARWQTALGLLYIATVLFAKDGIAGRVASVRGSIRQRRDKRRGTRQPADAATAATAAESPRRSHTLVMSSDDATWPK